MKYGVIDIGSNTMRAVVYQIEEDGNFHQVVNDKEFAEILSFVENNTLSAEGIFRLSTVLKRFSQLLSEVSCDNYSCFSTASLRNISNQTKVIESVKKDTGIDIGIMTGLEEAHYDYVGLSHCVDVKGPSIGFDLGGGSAQVFTFDQNGIISSTSNPMGSLAMYNRFVKGLFPNSKQRMKIAKFVHDELEKSIDIKNFQFDQFYGMGGTARALAKVHRHIFGRDAGKSGYVMSIEEIDDLDSTISMLGFEGIKILNRIIPERLVTFTPGLLTIKAIMQYVGARELTIVGYGVREGYLIDNAILKGRNAQDGSQKTESIH